MMAVAVRPIAPVVMATVPVIDNDMQHVPVMKVAMMKVAVTVAPPVTPVRIPMEPRMAAPVGAVTTAMRAGECCGGNRQNGEPNGDQSCEGENRPFHD